MAVLQALPSDWNTIHSIILNKSSAFTLQGTIDALLKHKNTLRQQHENVLMVHHDHKSQSPVPPNVVPRAPNRLICSNCKILGHSINTCCFEGGGAEGQNLKKKKSRPNLHSRGQKEATAHIAQENQSLSPPSMFICFLLMRMPFFQMKLVPPLTLLSLSFTLGPWHTLAMTNLIILPTQNSTPLRRFT